jgi:hypothetical protein
MQRFLTPMEAWRGVLPARLICQANAGHVCRDLLYGRRSDIDDLRARSNPRAVSKRSWLKAATYTNSTSFRPRSPGSWMPFRAGRKGPRNKDGFRWIPLRQRSSRNSSWLRGDSRGCRLDCSSAIGRLPFALRKVEHRGPSLVCDGLGCFGTCADPVLCAEDRPGG